MAEDLMGFRFINLDQTKFDADEDFIRKTANSLMNDVGYGSDDQAPATDITTDAIDGSDGSDIGILVEGTDFVF